MTPSKEAIKRARVWNSHNVRCTDCGTLFASQTALRDHLPCTNPVDYSKVIVI